MNNLLKVLLITPFIGGCASFNTGNYPENWGEVNSNGNNLINGTFKCKGESKSYYFMNESTDSFLPYLLETDTRHYEKCTSVSLTQKDTSSLTVKVNYKDKSISKTLKNVEDYEYKDGWYYFKETPYNPYRQPVAGFGSKRVSFSINSSENLVARISVSGGGVLLMVIPFITAYDEWNVFNKI